MVDVVNCDSSTRRDANSFAEKCTYLTNNKLASKNVFASKNQNDFIVLTPQKFYTLMLTH